MSHSSPSDPIGPELIRRIRSDDRDAFRTLFHACYPSLHRFARALLGDADDADDAIQDVFLRLWRNRAKLGEAGSVRSYLFTSVRNRSLDVLRRRQREGQRFATGPESDAEALSRPTQQATTAHSPLHGSIDDLPQDHSDTDPAALAELHEAIRRAVDGLPERCHTAFLLCREQDMSYAEAAVIMGVSPATVKAHMGRALAALRAALHPFLSASSPPPQR